MRGYSPAAAPAGGVFLMVRQYVARSTGALGLSEDFRAFDYSVIPDDITNFTTFSGSGAVNQTIYARPLTIFLTRE
jgi:hypothetical protein